MNNVTNYCFYVISLCLYLRLANKKLCMYNIVSGPYVSRTCRGEIRPTFLSERHTGWTQKNRGTLRLYMDQQIWKVEPVHCEADGKYGGTNHPKNQQCPF